MSKSETESKDSSYEEGRGGDKACEEVTGPLHVRLLNVQSPGRPSQEPCQLHGRLSYPNTLELKDTDGLGFFYALEDKDMIRWIGRENFIEVLTAYSTGWVKGICHFMSLSCLDISQTLMSVLSFRPSLSCLYNNFIVFVFVRPFL